MDKPEYPDLMIFDLDPPDDDFGPVRRTAFILRGLLPKLGLEAFVKSTGSRGLHVTVPLDRSANYDTVHAFTGDIAKLMAKQNPDWLTIEERKDKRRGGFYRCPGNSYNQTAVAPYTVRARPGAPVAAPLDWDEPNALDFKPQKYTINNIFQRLSKKGDPWANILQSAKSLDEARKQLDALV